MTKLGYLCISITLNSNTMRYRSSEEHAKLTDEFLKPLKAVRISAGADGEGGRGQFDVVTQRWRVTHELSDDVPFRVLFEERVATWW